MDFRTHRSVLLLLAAGAALGAGMWVLSPSLIGRAEPWDADSPIWPASWLVIAIVGGFTGSVRGLFLVVGFALGQVLATVRPLHSEFGALGLLFILRWMIAALAVTLALVGAQALARHLSRKLRASDGGVR